jgi:hypothetical protein
MPHAEGTRRFAQPVCVTNIFMDKDLKIHRIHKFLASFRQRNVSYNYHTAKELDHLLTRFRVMDG